MSSVNVPSPETVIRKVAAVAFLTLGSASFAVTLPRSVAATVTFAEPLPVGMPLPLSVQPTVNFTFPAVSLQTIRSFARVLPPK